MKGIILAAGRGSRMGNKTDNQPKCLTMLGGKSLLQYQLDALRGAGIEEIGIVRGYLAEEIHEENVVYFQNSRWNETNMVMSLCCAKEWLEKDECIISYADIVYLADTILGLKNDNNDISITYSTKWLELWQARFEDPLMDAETFKIDKDNKLLEIGNKANSIDEIKGQYMGLLKFTPKGWGCVQDLLRKLSQEKVDKMDMTTLLRNLINTNVEISTVPINGVWLEVDSREDLELYQTRIRRKEILLNV